MSNYYNFASSTLVTAVDADDTTFVVASGTVFPAAPFDLVLDSEIVRVTAKSGGTLTVLRGQQTDKGGGPATNHSSGTICRNYLTVDGLAEFIDERTAEIAELDGAISTVLTDDLTASRAVVSNGSGKLAASSVTATELGYVAGVTSAVQTQLDSKLATASTSYVSTAPGTDARNVITAGSSTVVPLTVKGAASQADDLLQIVNSAGTVNAKITAKGYLDISSSESLTNFEPIFRIRNTNANHGGGIQYITYAGDGTLSIEATILALNIAGVSKLWIDPTNGIQLNSGGAGSTHTIRFGDTYNGTYDVGLARNSAGVLRVSDGSSGAGVLTASRLISTVANGTAPMTVTSQTMVPNLNANYLGGYLAAAFVQDSAYTNRAQVNVGDVSSTYQFNLGTTRNFYVNVTGNIDFSITNPSNCTAGFVFHIAADGSSITWTGNYKWPGGSAPTLAAGDHVISGYYDAATGYYYMSYSDYT